MRRFVEEADRGQTTLLPNAFGDWVEESNPVRASMCLSRRSIWRIYSRDNNFTKGKYGELLSPARLAHEAVRRPVPSEYGADSSSQPPRLRNRIASKIPENPAMFPW